MITLGRGNRATRLVAVAALVAVLPACKGLDTNGDAKPATASAGSPGSGNSAGSAGSAGQERQQLNELKVAPRGSMDGYSRDSFPHWHSVEGTCNTREEVLKRDGKGVKVGSDCYPVSGAWTSPYDGKTWTRPSDLDIDHVVPLGQSWVSGARSWTRDRREQFANDLTRPQLKAVTDNLNEQKSDKAPDEWRPPLKSYWCTYATDWITVKHYYRLTVTTAEKSALSDMLGHC